MCLLPFSPSVMLIFYLNFLVLFTLGVQSLAFDGDGITAAAVIAINMMMIEILALTSFETENEKSCM